MVKIVDENMINSRKIIFVPAFLAFIIAMLLCFKFSYPISWDIYYHIHMANLYLNNGLVFWDYYTVAPSGRLIMYPPLFHLFLGCFSRILNLNVIATSWIAQPVFSFFLISVITYAAYKLSNKDVKVAVLTAFMAMMSFATFNRSVICTPATLAIAFSILACLYYYESYNEHDFKKVIFSSLSFAIICNLHMATAIITMGVLGLYTLYILLSRQINWRYLLAYILIALIFATPWWMYVFVNYGLVFNSIAGGHLRIDEFLIKYYGLIPTLFTLIGFFVLAKKRDNKSIFLIIWSLSIVILSQVYLIGINTVSIRIFEVSAYPLILIAGIGVSFFFEKINSTKLKNTLTILFILYSVFSCMAYVDSYTPVLLDDNDYNATILPDEFHLVFDPVGSILKPSIISDRYGNESLAHSRYELSRYLIANNISGLIVSEDAIMDTVMVSQTNVSVVYGGFTESIPEYVVDPVHIVKGWATNEELNKLNVSYLLVKKNTSVPSYATVEYENDGYKLCKVNVVGQKDEKTI